MIELIELEPGAEYSRAKVAHQGDPGIITKQLVKNLCGLMIGLGLTMSCDTSCTPTVQVILQVDNAPVECH